MKIERKSEVDEESKTAEKKNYVILSIRKEKRSEAHIKKYKNWKGGERKEEKGRALCKERKERKLTTSVFRLGCEKMTVEP